MKKVLFISCLLSLALIACGSKQNDPDPKPDPQPEEQYDKANTYVVYECNERLFAQTNAFKAIQDYLPTLQQMQVNVLWLMPIHPRGTVNSVNSPYCVKDFKDIDPKFGTLNDFKALVNDCHQRGMLVMLDWIANHTAFDNQWYLDHPDWYTSPTGDELNWKDVAPLNYDKQEVCDVMQDALVYWVREAGVDGYRCDYAHGVPASFWQNAIKAVRNVNPNAIFLAETSKTEYYAAGFDWLYSWNYLSAIQNLFKGSKTLSALYGTSTSEYSSTPSGKERLRYVTSHDASSENAPSSFYKTAKGELAACCLTYFLGGVPMMYSSQEIGDMSKINFFNYDIKQFGSSNETTQAYIALMKAYTATAEARVGEMSDYSSEKVAMFSRSQKDKKMLVVVNTTNTEQTITLPLAWQRDQFVDALTGDSVWTPKSLTLGGYDYHIYTK